MYDPNSVLNIKLNYKAVGGAGDVVCSTALTYLHGQDPHFLGSCGCKLVLMFVLLALTHEAPSQTVGCTFFSKM